MTKYRRQSGGRWTISSTLMGWGVTAVAILLVGFFLVGMYVGYGMGVEEGKKQVREQVRADNESGNVSDQIARLARDSTESKAVGNQKADGMASKDRAQSADQGNTGPRNGAFTEDELGIGSEPDQKSQSPSADSENNEKTDQESTSSDRISAVESEPEEKNTTESQSTDEGLGSQTDTSELKQFYTIQTVSFKKQQFADRAAERLRDLGHTVSINDAVVNGTQYFRVRVGEFPTRKKAQTYANDMKNRGEIEDYWISQVTRE